MKAGRAHSVFFGDVAQDEYYLAPHFPVAGDKVIVEALPVQYGGMVANSAAIFAHYGLQTSFMSHLNPGALTQKLLRQLRELGMNTDHVIFDERVPDSHCIVLLSGDQHVVIIPQLGITRSEITPAAFEHMAEAEFLVTTITDAKPFRMGEQTASEILFALRERGVQIVMDVDVFNLENQTSGLIDYCDILFMNTLGERRFTESGHDIGECLAAGATAIVVTRDSAGCELHTTNGMTSIPGFPVDVVDVTGAGDTFSSSFLYAYSTTGDLGEAAEFANAAAALSVGAVGARGGMTTPAIVNNFRSQII